MKTRQCSCPGEPIRRFTGARLLTRPAAAAQALENQFNQAFTFNRGNFETEKWAKPDGGSELLWAAANHN